MPLPDMTPAQLLAGAREVAERAPDATLVKNQVGNLAIVQGGEMTGWLNLRYGTVHWSAGDVTGGLPASPAPVPR